MNKETDWRISSNTIDFNLKRIVEEIKILLSKKSAGGNLKAKH